MPILLRIIGYGWIGLATIAIMSIYFVLFSARWPVLEDAIGAAVILSPGLAAIALATLIDQRNVRSLERRIAPQAKRA